jgi:hypothetical protein
MCKTQHTDDDAMNHDDDDDEQQLIIRRHEHLLSFELVITNYSITQQFNGSCAETIEKSSNYQETTEIEKLDIYYILYIYYGIYIRIL